MMRLLGILICLSLASCATSVETPLTEKYHAEDFAVEKRPLSEFKAKDSYVSLRVPLAPVEKFKKDIENTQQLALKNRGEAHITIVTPPELLRLKKVLSEKQIQQQVVLSGILKADFKPLCLGKAQLKEMATYFVVVEAEDIYRFRKKLQEQFVAKGGKVEDFNAELYNPHITVGFTDRDLHLEEGALKDASSCFIKLQPSRS